MISGLLGKKLGMTQVFSENGTVIPVTMLQVGPCYVTQIKTEEIDGYSAIQLGFLDKKEKNTPNSELGIYTKAKLKPKSFVREIKIEKDIDVSLGQEITVDIFEENSVVNVIGTTKGKGFAGVMKRWGFHGGPAAHGCTVHRRPGSASPGTYPGRVIKGKKMPGRLGNKRKSIRNLDVVKVDKSNNIMMLKGAVPGANGSCVIIHKI